ncbi:MAG: SDR family oxidoreductase [Caulobacteraceae bacterium]|nr:SDR family oxidoreductase [Caulobacteraceae bacterium]
MDLQLKGKRALVTGGSRGIGKAIALGLAREGVDLVVAARTREPLEASAAEVAANTGARVIAIPADTGQDGSVKSLIAATVEALGGLDILVNCAAQPMGQSAPPRLPDVTDAVFYDDVNVKVMGYLRTAREAAPVMIAQGWGRIINVSGLGARQTGSIVGSMRNVAVAALTKNLADELGPNGINVTVVHPGLTRTEATPEVTRRLAARSAASAEDIEARWGANVSIGRIIDAAEVADVVVFLASPRSVAINGDAIACGGGARGSIHY